MDSLRLLLGRRGLLVEPGGNAARGIAAQIAVKQRDVIEMIIFARQHKRRVGWRRDRGCSQYPVRARRTHETRLWGLQITVQSRQGNGADIRLGRGGFCGARQRIHAQQIDTAVFPSVLWVAWGDGALVGHAIASRSVSRPGGHAARRVRAIAGGQPGPWP